MCRILYTVDNFSKPLESTVTSSPSQYKKRTHLVIDMPSGPSLYKLQVITETPFPCLINSRIPSDPLGHVGLLRKYSKRSVVQLLVFIL